MSFAPNIEYMLIVVSNSRKVKALCRIMAMAYSLHKTDFCYLAQRSNGLCHPIAFSG